MKRTPRVRKVDAERKSDRPEFADPEAYISKLRHDIRFDRLLGVRPRVG